ncbi:MAG: TonB-dependent receptor [Myxococcales bacterium]|nr:TonB-dependent receptor [Myxococcales bacterium]
MTKLLYTSCAFVVLASAGAVTRADDKEPVVTTGEETIFVIAPAPDHAARDRDRALGEAPFVTVLHPGDHAATASVADAVATSAGAIASSLGGLGAYQSISVRGAAPGHTAVLIDGVPLAKLAAVTTDLGRFPLDAFGEVRFYRGAVPVELGGAGIGGAVDLVTKLGRGPRGERWTATAGVGSYGARHLRARYGDEHVGGQIESSTTIGYQGATGDYTYFDDNGTLLNKADDGFKTRGNNGFDQIDATSRIGAPDALFGVGLRLAFKRQGLPGSTAQPADSARLSTFDGILDASIPAQLATWAGRIGGFLLLERQKLRDPDGELGLGRAERSYTTIAMGVSSSMRRALGAQELALGAELRADGFTDRDDASEMEAVDGVRAGGAAMASIDLHLAPQLVVTPALRLDALYSEPTPISVGPTAGLAVPSRWDVVPSPRVTALLTVTDDLAIKGSTGLYTRLPTLLEVFGNRGFILGAPDLKAERGPASDLGVVWAPARAVGGGDIDRVLVQADVFASRAHDTIAFITTAGFVTRAANIGDTQAYGAELIASLRLARTLSLTASYTRLETEQMSSDVNLDGKPVPRRPNHVAYGRADAERRVLGRTGSVWIDGSYQAQSFLDPASLGITPRRLLIGTGARVEVVRGLAVALAVQNVADVRIAYLQLDRRTPTPLTDVAGFPLPGRSFYLSVDVTH